MTPEQQLRSVAKQILDEARRRVRGLIKEIAQKWNEWAEAEIKERASILAARVVKVQNEANELVKSWGFQAEIEALEREPQDT